MSTSELFATASEVILKTSASSSSLNENIPRSQFQIDLVAIENLKNQQDSKGMEFETSIRGDTSALSIPKSNESARTTETSSIETSDDLSFQKDNDLPIRNLMEKEIISNYQSTQSLYVIDKNLDTELDADATTSNAESEAATANATHHVNATNDFSSIDESEEAMASSMVSKANANYLANAMIDPKLDTEKNKSESFSAEEEILIPNLIH